MGINTKCKESIPALRNAIFWEPFIPQLMASLSSNFAKHHNLSI
ncbi:hypothetical protein T4A_10648 [Trichinella pseudospiralis]|uniref:Uncharacterized protein n=1 Tax=Trichinella pseudospiralis TaxID=6337 RepID=A0A0V1DNN7_TRIPS|nr:hypothetical protein T4A_10648 [Trichinella pseudospiralis]